MLQSQAVPALVIAQTKTWLAQLPCQGSQWKAVLGGLPRGGSHGSVTMARDVYGKEGELVDHFHVYQPPSPSRSATARIFSPGPVRSGQRCTSWASQPDSGTKVETYQNDLDPPQKPQPPQKAQPASPIRIPPPEARDDTVYSHKRNRNEKQEQEARLADPQGHEFGRAEPAQAGRDDAQRGLDRVAGRGEAVGEAEGKAQQEAGEVAVAVAVA